MRSSSICAGQDMPPNHSAVTFLLDVDNTLLDNDRVTADLRHHLESTVGRERANAYWVAFEELRAELGYADYLGALQRYRVAHPRDLHVLTVSRFLLDYPFADRLFPQALEVIAHLRQWGTTVILSDGDVVFQPRKIERSGLFASVGGNVLVYIHKERELEDVEQRYPADRYVMVDDKLRILVAMKQQWQSRLTTVFVRQGHYAHDAHVLNSLPPADVTLEGIADMQKYDLQELLALSKSPLHG
ncbi:MAG TPA: HAD family hydrolase [Nitrospira sp.]|nr:HAD family hydrolase [Nitrospira sp.]